MIPLKLELKNFMAYREPDPLDLSGMHTVVLTGENGAGKSSLLDAITWVLWGQARTRRDDDLITQNENEMRVALTFSEGRSMYQVVRTRKLGKASSKRAQPVSSGTLDLLIQEDGSWRSLSEVKIADTERKIAGTLKLSYDAFLNSAYLKQGRADEFATRTPAERKALLSEILNLDAWQEFDQNARQRAEIAEREEAVRVVELARHEDEIGKLPQYERERDDARDALAAHEATLQEAEHAQAGINALREQHSAVRAQLIQAERSVQAIQEEMAGLQREMTVHQQQHDAYGLALAERDQIGHGFSELERARAQNELLNQKVGSMVDLNARKMAAESAIADARRVLERQRDEATHALRALELELAAAPAQQALDALRSRLAEAEHAQQQRDALLRASADARENTATLRAQNDTLRREMQVIKARMDALKSTGAVCDTCGRELAEPERARILEELQQEGKRLGDLHRANNGSVEQAGARQKEAEAEVRVLEQRATAAAGAQRELAQLEAGAGRAAQACDALPAAQARLDDATRQIAANGFAGTAHAELELVMHALEVLGYDRASHRVLTETTLPALQPFAARKAQLDKAGIGIESEQRALDALSARVALARHGLGEASARLDALRNSERALNVQLAGSADVAAQLQRTRSAVFASQRRVGEAEQRLNAASSLLAVAARLRGELVETRDRKNLLGTLREAFGRNGVPAMVIEAALPALEANANALLFRMSGGRIKVKFETMRLTRANDVSETLDIRISDDVGERAYEMFSGGELFRVNFAIRIAMSQLLSHRQGARLQTLFIDEGFGTQDAQGRERLIDAIRAIEDDFERIFVITHIDEMKDAFPTRIEVTKTANGSIARIM